MVVAVDGDAKCGKTAVINTIAEEAQWQESVITEVADGRDQITKHLLNNGRPDLAEELMLNVSALRDAMCFRSIRHITGGNYFRAAALDVVLREQYGERVGSFTEEDVERLQALLAVAGVERFLQESRLIGDRVACTSQLPGVQAICGRLLCNTVANAFHEGGGANLVVVDARDPVGHLMRNGALGNEPQQIPVGNILPIYIDSPVETAASRMRGDHSVNLQSVVRRRQDDATRAELPIVRPAQLIQDFSVWLESLVDAPSHGEVAPAFRAYNGEGVGLDNIQFLGGVIAAAAQDLGYWRWQESKDREAAA